MPAPSDRDYGLLVQLLALLDSPSLGERQAALEAVSRQLAAIGTTWRDLAAELPAGAADDGPLRLAEAVSLMRAARGVLTPCETKFLIGIEALAALSEKQRTQLVVIRRKVAAAHAAEAAA